ncbi:hypothetical protein ID866_3591 [Astraeus odoratus]|nr:hypothetical protein ID866_3591 [Astraeus odoratus]
MPLSDYIDPSDGPTATPTAAPDFATPKNGSAVAVALTVGIVGVFMFALITWLVLRLRRQPAQQNLDVEPTERRVSTVSERFRPSFASEASSRFGFKRKSLRLVDHQRDDGSWDFTDADPMPNDMHAAAAAAKHIPPPLLSPNTPSYHSRTSKEHWNPSSPSTPRSFDIEPPPPAYTRDRPTWIHSEHKDSP